MIGAQLPLAVQLRDTASFDTYFPGPNVEAVAALREARLPALLFGAEGSGRTHLLQACCREHAGTYLPLGAAVDYGPDALDGLIQPARLYLDDLDAWLGEREREFALLRLLDARRAAQHVTVLAASAPPERLILALPDLRTRLSALTVLGLRPLDDAQRAQLLRTRAMARGLELPEEVSRWLLHTQARGAAPLLDALDRLDRASLSAKRRLTLPFVQSVLATG